MTPIRTLLRVLVLLKIVEFAANAGLLGSSATIDYEYGEPGHYLAEPAQFTVGPGVEFIGYLGLPAFNVDIGDNTIKFFGWPYAQAFSGPAHGDQYNGHLVTFNGPVFTDTNVVITGVSIDPATTMTGLPEVTFDSHHIYVNWMDLSYSQNTVVLLNVIASSFPVGPQIGDGSARVQANGAFGFTISEASDQTVVVEASTNLVNWDPIWTNALSGTNAAFTDPLWTNYPNRFYRAR